MTNMYLQIGKGIVRADNFDAVINMHLQDKKGDLKVYIMGSMTIVYLQIRKCIVIVGNFDAMVNLHLQNIRGIV